MKTFKRIWTTLKKYKYYTLTLIILLILSIAAGKIFNIDVGTPALIIFWILYGSIFYAVGWAVYNTWVVDGDKVEAVIVGIFGIAFLTFTIYLIITKVL